MRKWFTVSVIAFALLSVLATRSDARRRNVPVFGTPQIQGDIGDPVKVSGTYTVGALDVSLQQEGLAPNARTVSVSGEIYTDSDSGTVCVEGYVTLSSTSAGTFSAYEVPCK